MGGPDGGGRGVKQQGTHNQGSAFSHGAGGFRHLFPPAPDGIGVESAVAMRSGQDPQRPLFRAALVEVQAHGEHGHEDL